MAELKLAVVLVNVFLFPGFHGVTTVAELKQREGSGLDHARAAFPRRHNRGRIEAFWKMLFV